MKMSRSRTLLTFALAAAVAGAAAPAAQAADCPKKPNELSRKGAGVIWQQAGSLYLCTAYYDQPPISAKVGPWKKGKSHFAFDGNHVVWAVDSGAQEDRIWAADGPRDVWIKGWRPVTGITGVIDQEVARLAVYGEVAAWVTTQGQVVQAVNDGGGEPPEQVGAGTPGAAPPATDPSASAGEVEGYQQGLLAPSSKPARRRLIGRWTPMAAQPRFAKSLKVEVVPGAGDGDECGGVNQYRVTVRPLADQPRVGFSTFVSWARDCG